MTIAELEKKLLTREPLPPLSPTRVFDGSLRASIQSLPVSEMAKAGWHLWNDDLDACHQIAQAHEVPDGNYWHAILHRREGDLSNAGYWYRRVGHHPVLLKMKAIYPEWTWEAFLTWSEEALAGKREALPLQVMQAAEMRLLLEASA